MPTPKNPKPAVDDAALLAALSEPAVPVAAKAPAPAEEPRIARVEEDPTVADRIKALIETLGGDVDEVANIEIRRPGLIRIVSKDRGLRSRRFDWPKNEVAE